MCLKTPLICSVTATLIWSVFSLYWCLVTPKLGYVNPILVSKYTKNMCPLHCPGVLVTIKKGNDDTEYV